MEPHCEKHKEANEKWKIEQENRAGHKPDDGIWQLEIVEWESNQVKTGTFGFLNKRNGQLDYPRTPNITHCPWCGGALVSTANATQAS